MPETERQRTERLLREMLARAKAGDQDDVPDDLTISSLIRRSAWLRRIKELRKAVPRLPRPRLPRLDAKAIARRLPLPRTGMRLPWTPLHREPAMAMAMAAAGPAWAAQDKGAGRRAGALGRDEALEQIFSGAHRTGLETVHLPRSGKLKRIDPVMGAIAPGRDRSVQPAVQYSTMKKQSRRGDLIMAVCGVALGLTCAMFPWYIFFNQDQFGVQGIRVGGRGHNSGRIVVDPRPSSDTPVAFQDVPKNLDIFTTGTLQQSPEQKHKPPGPGDQPFPAEVPEFRLVHVANGRAMIEDDAGLWIVQPGSTLPDSSQVKSIEQRKGKWVLVTSTDRVVEISR